MQIGERQAQEEEKKIQVQKQVNMIQKKVALALTAVHIPT